APERSVRAAAGAALRGSRAKRSRRGSREAGRSRLSHRADARADARRDVDGDCVAERSLARRPDRRAAQPQRVPVDQVSAMHRCKTCWSRREFLFRSGGGVSGLALAYLLNRDGRLVAAAPDGAGGACSATPIGSNPYAPKAPHFTPRAKAVISLFMS